MAETERDPSRPWRERRIAHLVGQIEAGTYSVPATDVAHAILFGRPKWGDDPRLAESSMAPLVGLDLTALPARS